MFTHTVYGYTYSGGYALCTKHATDTTDADNDTGHAYPVYSWENLSSDLVCDVAGCGVILEQTYEEEA